MCWPPLHTQPPEDALYFETLGVGEAAIVTCKAVVDSLFTNTFEGAGTIYSKQ